MLLEQLKNNKGTVSSKLGKELATKVVNGELDILEQAVELVSYEADNKKSKNIRAGAAKIIEKVAEVKPALVAPYLENMFKALEVFEPQTRWMVIRTFGYCAKYNDEVSAKGIPYARDYIREQQGVCLSGAAERYLGDLGSVSKAYSQAVYPILIEAYDNAIPNEIDWIFEAFINIAPHLEIDKKQVINACASEHLNATRKTTVKRALKIIDLTQ